MGLLESLDEMKGNFKNYSGKIDLNSEYIVKTSFNTIYWGGKISRDERFKVLGFNNKEIIIKKTNKEFRNPKPHSFLIKTSEFIKNFEKWNK